MVHAVAWTKPTRMRLPEETDLLWLERYSMLGRHSLHPDRQVSGFYNQQCLQQVYNATMNHIPIVLGDPHGTMTRAHVEALITGSEVALGAAALTQTSTHGRQWTKALLRKLFAPESGESDAAEDEPDITSTSMTRRALFGAAGAYLTLPAVERFRQLAAPESSTTAAIRELNATLHPEDCPHTLRIRNTVHAIMMEHVDQQSPAGIHHTSMFGAWHSGILDEVGRSRTDKLRYLHEVGIDKINHPSFWEIHGFVYDPRKGRHVHAVTDVVPELEKLCRDDSSKQRIWRDRIWSKAA